MYGKIIQSYFQSVTEGKYIGRTLIVAEVFNVILEVVENSKIGTHIFNIHTIMIEKKFTTKRTICKVTFSIPKDWADREVSVVGDFNDWDTEANKLTEKNGSWEVTLRLTPEREYRFRYLLDGERWANDNSADGYASNAYGTEDSLLVIGS